MLSLTYCEIEGSLGLELNSLDTTATVADLFPPLQRAADDPMLPKTEHKARMAACAGCSNNCCRRYDILPDLLTVKKLQQYFALDLASFCKQFLRMEDDLLFAEFRGRHCPFLKRELCSIYTMRPAFCRFYLCVPISERLDKLKAQILLLGEFALREHLIANQLGSATWLHGLGATQMLDWPGKNPFVTATDYGEIRLRSCCSDLLWEWLQLPPEQASWQSYASWRKIKGE